VFLWVILVQKCQENRTINVDASPSLCCSQGANDYTYEIVVISWPLLNGQHSADCVMHRVLTLADAQSDEYRKVDITGNPGGEISARC
jgi:hypothetical protein